MVLCIGVNCGVCAAAPAAGGVPRLTHITTHKPLEPGQPATRRRQYPITKHTHTHTRTHTMRVGVGVRARTHPTRACIRGHLCSANYTPRAHARARTHTHTHTHTQVLKSAPAKDQGVREEWEQRTGWHRCVRCLDRISSTVFNLSCWLFFIPTRPALHCSFKTGEKTPRGVPLVLDAGGMAGPGADDTSRIFGTDLRYPCLVIVHTSSYAGSSLICFAHGCSEQIGR